MQQENVQLEANKIEQKEDENENENEDQRSSGRRTFHDNCVRTERAPDQHAASKKGEPERQTT